MNSNTKIVVIRMKELIAGAIAVIAAVILLAVIISSNSCSSDSKDTAGIVQSSKTAPTTATGNSGSTTGNSTDNTNGISGGSSGSSSSGSSSGNSSGSSSGNLSGNSAVKTSSDQSVANTYIPGVYTASITLNGNPVDVQVTVDKNNINSIELKNLSDSVTTMYPMIENSFNSLAKSVIETGSTDNITYSSENKYTSTILLDAIKNALAKCTVK